MLTAITVVCTTMLWLSFGLILLSPFPKYIGAGHYTLLFSLTGLTGVLLSIVLMAVSVAFAFDPPLSSFPGMVLTHLSLGPLLLGQHLGIRLEESVGGLDRWLLMTGILVIFASWLGYSQLKTR